MKKSIFVALALLCACSASDPLSDAGNDDASTDASAQDQFVPDVTLKDTSTQDADASVDADMDAGDGYDGAPDLDAGNDASTLPPEGSPCSKPAEVQSEPCGFCGTHDRACLPDGDGGHAWGAWGYCQGQPSNACDPNKTYSDISCPGKCATQQQVCLSNCTFDQTQPCNEPTNACWPNNFDYEEGLSCTTGGRERVCDSQCQWGNFGACQSGPSMITLQVPSTVGDVTSIVQNLDSNNTLPRVVTASCPSTLSTTSTAYNYVVVHNPSTQYATVDIFHSAASGGPTIDTVMTVYPGTTPPANNDTAARQACVGYVDDNCTDTSSTNPKSCASSWAGLMVGNGHGVTIPANGDVVVYSAALSSGAGDFQINVRAKAFNNAYKVGGSVSGLTGTVILKNNGTDALTLSANNTFNFATSIITGGTYNVTVDTQPSGQICAVTNGLGAMGTSDVTNVGVTCATPSTIGGTVSGLSGSVTLQNNGGNNLIVSANGSFTFTQSAVPYNVTVLKHPAGQTCTVTNGSGVATSAVTNVTVQCAATVSGVPQVMNVPSSLNTVTSMIQTFSTTATLTRVGSTGGNCPATLSTSSTSYDYVVIHNPNTVAVTLDVFHSSAPDTVMAVYSGTIPPTTTTARQNCVGYQDDSCFDTSNITPPSCASFSQAGLMVGDNHGVTIPAGSDVVVYSAVYSGTSSSDFQINVKPRSFQ
jgi:hypothetical protein